MRKAFLFILLPLFVVSHLFAQIQVGTVQGSVRDQTGAVLPGVEVVLSHPITGFHRTSVTDSLGGFVFQRLSFDLYTLRAASPGFHSQERIVPVRSNLPQILEITLEVTEPREEVSVEAPLPLTERDSPSTRTNLDENFIRRLSRASSGAQLQETIATVPGWSLENNGLLHSRGVDDGFLFVLDGIPMADRIDLLFAAPLDMDLIQSLQVINGHIPAEYGNASGGVINILSSSSLGAPWEGTARVGAGSLQTGEVSYNVRGGLGSRVGLSLMNSWSGSGERYLDPVDPDNFNNRGGAVRLNILGDWQPTAKDTLRFNVSINGSDFRVTNSLEQELAGQRQRQELRDNTQSVLWQHVWSSDRVINVGGYRRFNRSELFPSLQDTPLSASQLRENVRQGFLANFTLFEHGHIIKMGIHAQRVTPEENFSFFVTDDQADLNPLVRQFDQQNPFSFQDRVTQGEFALYIQDTFSFGEEFTLDAGVRFDHTSLLVSESQFSPRVAAVYYFPESRTALRGSYNRLFMSPQVENLLLASSEQARALSPFVTPEGTGGADIRPERQHAFEVGVSQDVGSAFRLDIAHWWRFVRNYADPNVFFGTAVIFPNSVAEGEAQGVDVRIDIPERRGWSGYASYSNSRTFQIGPINGGLFLEDEVIEIGPGTRFTPDHDQRNVASFGVSYRNLPTGLWVTFSGRHESGTPLEVDEDELDELMQRRGAERVNFDRQRVKGRTPLNLAFGADLRQDDDIAFSARLDIRNLTGEEFAFNFGNPFSGTHFGHPRLWRVELSFSFR